MWSSRRRQPIDEGWPVLGTAVAVVGALVLAGQLAPVTVAIVAGGGGAGAALGRWRSIRVWAPDVEVTVLVTMVVVFAALPDTEGSTLLGAALVPLSVGALARRTWWEGAAAGAAIGALATAAAAISLAAAAGRTGALAVVAAGAAISATLVVGAQRLLVERVPPVTSGRARPSR